MARSMPSVLQTFVLLATLSEIATAESWDPSTHYAGSDNLRAPRTARRIPRRLKARRAANTTQPGQPPTVADNLIGGFAVVGDSGVSAQQMFLGTDNLVYIIDKVEANPLTINDHSAWATVYDLTQNSATPLEVVTNTFCAGGGQLGDGRWLNLGGNQAVDPGGYTHNASSVGNPYQDSDGGFAARTITPGSTGEWIDDHNLDMKVQRWYPTLEPMTDGRIFVLGGNHVGGFVNDAGNSEPTYEFWPPRNGEGRIGSPILEDTLPANLYPIAHMLPSGQILLNINRGAAILDVANDQEYRLPEVPHAVRTYPASAATAMFPLTAEGGWNATVMYCGGSDISKDQWLNGEPLLSIPASASCIRISPATQADFEDDDSLPEGRVMGNAILLPDSTILVLNGANTGVSGYAFNNPAQQAWSRDDGFADIPVTRPVIYDPARPAGSRWSRAGLKESAVPRMYHSTATLLPDGSVLVSGSNPHPDYSPDKTYPTEYRVERFYPSYYNKRRPEPAGIPSTISYGGQYFELQLSADDLSGNQGNLNAVKIWLIRTGFSTHGINFGMKMVELDHTYTANADGSATLHVSQAPPNAAIIQPGTAWFFVVVNGVPSVGVQVMVGSGNIEDQTMQDPEPLPESNHVSQAADQTPSHPNAGTTVTTASSIISSFFLFMVGGLALLG